MRTLKREEKALSKRLVELEGDRKQYDYCIGKAWETSGVKSKPEKATDFEWALVVWTDLKHAGLKDEVYSSIAEKMSPYKFLLSERREEFGKEWKKSSFARLSLGHKVGAALALTSAPDDEVIAPWGAWSLQVPDHLIPIDGGDESKPRKRDESLKLEADKAIEKALGIKDDLKSTILNKSSLDLNDKKQVLHELIDELPPPACDIQRVFCLDSEPVFVLARTEATKSFVVLSHQGREKPPVWWELIRNLVKGACIVLDGAAPEKASKGGSWSASTRGRNGPPQGAQYQLGKEVAIDLRDELRRVLIGPKTGGAPAVQFLVRGHWRRQAHGEGRLLRRRQWIEPFWKGPEEARVLLRGHAVKS